MLPIQWLKCRSKYIADNGCTHLTKKILPLNRNAAYAKQTNKIFYMEYLYNNSIIISMHMLETKQTKPPKANECKILLTAPRNPLGYF